MTSHASPAAPSGGAGYWARTLVSDTCANSMRACGSEIKFVRKIPPSWGMRILHVSKLYAHRPWLHWVSNQAHNYDVVVIAGNLLGVDRGRSRIEDIRWVTDWSYEFSGRMVIASGPFDVEPVGYTAPWLRSIARHHVCVDGQRMLFGEWCIEAVPLYGYPDGEGRRHVMVRSIPPAGELIGVDAESHFDDGCPRLAQILRLRQQRFYAALCGLVPSPYHWFGAAGGTPCFTPGVGSVASQRPNYLSHDLDRREVTWHPNDDLACKAGVKLLSPS